ncbi:putative tetR-family transcriptional regulator [Streptomyces sp. Tu6071]|nr:putative tetR-family transcriptional regulator [Streptomyces sp. Tu6071]
MSPGLRPRPRQARGREREEPRHQLGEGPVDRLAVQDAPQQRGESGIALRAHREQRDEVVHELAFQLGARHAAPVEPQEGRRLGERDPRPHDEIEARRGLGDAEVGEDLVPRRLPHRVDERVRRLPRGHGGTAAHERREPGTVRVHEVEVPLHDPQQPRAERPFVRLHEAVREVVGGPAQRGLVEAELPGEVVVHEGPRDPGGSRDLVYGHVGGRAAAEQLQCHGDQLFPTLLDTHPAAHPGRHTNSLPRAAC